jgi:hypothetical protein
MQATLPLFEPTIPPTLTGQHLAVASLLLDHRGRGVLSSRVIAERVGLRHSADVRHIIQELVDEFALEIVGDRTKRDGGYRFADTRAEFEEAQTANLAQAVTTMTRIKSRLGPRGFRAALVRLKVREALELEGLTEGA